MTTRFENVAVEKKANVYFEGKVASRTLLFADGSKKTLGIMQPGEYEFSTNQKEEMDFSSGKLEYQLEGEEWKTIDGEGVFVVPANSKFRLKVYSVADYCCSYFA